MFSRLQRVLFFTFCFFLKFRFVESCQTQTQHLLLRHSPQFDNQCVDHDCKLWNSACLGHLMKRTSCTTIVCICLCFIYMWSEMLWFCAVCVHNLNKLLYISYITFWFHVRINDLSSVGKLQNRNLVIFALFFPHCVRFSLRFACFYILRTALSWSVCVWKH